VNGDSAVRAILYCILKLLVVLGPTSYLGVFFSEVWSRLALISMLVLSSSNSMIAFSTFTSESAFVYPLPSYLNN
jgi:cytochrome c oxidase subunit IV